MRRHIFRLKTLSVSEFVCLYLLLKITTDNHFGFPSALAGPAPDKTKPDQAFRYREVFFRFFLRERPANYMIDKIRNILFDTKQSVCLNTGVSRKPVLNPELMVRNLSALEPCRVRDQRISIA